MKEALQANVINIPVFTLKSISVFTKFTFLIGATLRYWTYTPDPSRLLFLATPEQYLKGRKAMYEHKSQLVWFRHLFLVLSQYMILNELEKI
jgi:N-acetylglucosaminylphosphatidylinositol deacetylase